MTNSHRNCNGMDAKKAELLEKIAGMVRFNFEMVSIRLFISFQTQKEKKKTLDQRMGEVIVKWAETQHTELEDYSEAAYERHVEIEDTSLCGAVHNAMGLATEIVQQQSLKRTLMCLDEVVLQRLFQ